MIDYVILVANVATILVLWFTRWHIDRRVDAHFRLLCGLEKRIAELESKAR